MDADSGNLGNYIGVSALKSHLNSDLILGEMIEFSIPGTQFRGNGLTTANFELILRSYVTALYQNPGDLTDRQREIAIKCAVITAGLVRTGLDALVDEAPFQTDPLPKSLPRQVSRCDGNHRNCYGAADR